MTRAEQEVPGLCHLEEGDASAGTDHPGELCEEGIEVDEVAEREAAGGAVDRPVGEREAQDVRLGQRDIGVGRTEHADAEIEADGSATLKIYRNPLVNWIWIGGYTFVVGTLLIMWPHAPLAARRKEPQEESAG